MSKAKTMTKRTQSRNKTNYSSVGRSGAAGLQVARASKGKGSFDNALKGLMAGSEPKPNIKPKKKIKVPKAGPGKKRVQGSSLKRNTPAMTMSKRGITSGGGSGGGGEWVTVKGRRIPLGKG
jgi:hypothetical protein